MWDNSIHKSITSFFVMNSLGLFAIEFSIAYYVFKINHGMHLSINRLSNRCKTGLNTDTFKVSYVPD